MGTPTKLIRIKDVAAKLGIAQSTAWKYVSNGKIPQPYAKLSAKCTVWDSDEIDKLVEDFHNNANPEHDSVNFKVNSA